MPLVAEFAVETDRLPLVDVAKAVPSTTLYTELVPASDGPPPLVLRAIGEEVEALEAALEASEFVDALQRVGVADGTHHYQVLPTEGMEAFWGDDFDVDGLRALASRDAIIEEQVITPTGWVQTGWFAEVETLQAFRAFWQDQGVPFTVRRLTRRGETAPPGDGLTDRQREALRVAYERGYFEIPRQASLEEVAAELDISPSSLSERLRRAQTQVIETTVAGTWPSLPE